MSGGAVCKRQVSRGPGCPGLTPSVSAAAGYDPRTTASLLALLIEACRCRPSSSPDRALVRSAIPRCLRATLRRRLRRPRPPRAHVGRRGPAGWLRGILPRTRHRLRLGRSRRMDSRGRASAVTSPSRIRTVDEVAPPFRTVAWAPHSASLRPAVSGFGSCVRAVASSCPANRKVLCCAIGRKAASSSGRGRNFRRRFTSRLMLIPCCEASSTAVAVACRAESEIARVTPLT